MTNNGSLIVFFYYISSQVSKMYQMQHINNYNNHIRNQILKKKRGGKKSNAWTGHGTKSFYSEFAYPAYTKSG